LTFKRDGDFSEKERNRKVSRSKPETESKSCTCGGNGRAEDTRLARRLEYITIGWNLVEAGVAIGAGVMAGSISLVGFGVDTLIEIFASLILLWRLWSVHYDERREQIALKLVGASFLLLAVYIACEAASSLLSKQPPEASLAGIVLAALSMLIKPLLASAKRRVAGLLNSAALNAESRQSSICAYLAAILLGGLALNTLFHWWWADPVAAILMVPLIVKEGLDALRGEFCADCQ
jgi:divalent metal cation (Fe/Co/Zn/Cd) transporter